MSNKQPRLPATDEQFVSPPRGPSDPEPTPEPATPKKKTGGQIITDPELAAINRISKLLNALDENQRHRVMTYLSSRFEPPLFRNPPVLVAPKEPGHAED